MLQNLCIRSDFELIYHQQITAGHIWEDGTHLMKSGKSVLAKSFFIRVNSFEDIQLFFDQASKPTVASVDFDNGSLGADDTADVSRVPS